MHKFLENLLQFKYHFLNLKIIDDFLNYFAHMNFFHTLTINAKLNMFMNLNNVCEFENGSLIFIRICKFGKYFEFHEFVKTFHKFANYINLQNP